MMLVVGLFIVPLVIYLIIRNNDYRTTIKQKRLINFILLAIDVLFLVVTFAVNMDPFKFDIERPGDYFIYSLVIFIFTPFLWISFGYLILNCSKSLRIKQKSKAKNKSEYTYYRDMLDKVSPGVLMYTRYLDIRFKDVISSTILKLKLSKNIKETKNNLQVITDSNVSKSELMILDLIKGKSLDKNEYLKNVRNEAKELGYIKRNNKNIFFRLIKIIFLVLIPTLIIMESIKFDGYVFDNYKTYVKDGNRYVLIKDDIGYIKYDHPDNFNDYYHGRIKELGNKEFYDESLVRANLYSNRKVKETAIYQSVDLIFMIFAFINATVCFYLLIEQLIYIKNNDKRTKEGIDILNKSYALKNFLEDFSDIKNRKEEELILWDYYLIYATALGINVKINDSVIEKYIK